MGSGSNTGPGDGWMKLTPPGLAERSKSFLGTLELRLTSLPSTIRPSLCRRSAQAMRRFSIRATCFGSPSISAERGPSQSGFE